MIDKSSTTWAYQYNGGCNVTLECMQSITYSINFTSMQQHVI